MGSCVSTKGGSTSPIMASNSRRNSASVATPGPGSRRGSCDSEVSSIFPNTLKKGKPVSQVKITFMGKPMELLVPMNDDVNIYDGTDINASLEKKSKNTWIEMFDMIDLTFNNLQQQNKELKRTVNELSSKINKMAFHAGKETSKTTSPPAKPKNASNGDAKEYTQGQVQEINKKVDGKIQKVEENILQWIDEETKCLKDSLEKDITAIRSEVDEKNIELNSKVQATISNLKEEVNDKVAMMDTKLTDTMFNDNGNDLPLDDSEPSTGTNRQIMDLKNRLHSNCNTLRFLCSEPLSVQFSIWSKKEIKVPLTGDSEVVPFNWVNCNSGGAVDDDGISDITTIYIPVSGPYLLSLGCSLLSSSGTIVLKRNNKERVIEAGRCDIVDLNEDDCLKVMSEPGTKAKDISLMGLLLRPRVFITPGTTL